MGGDLCDGFNMVYGTCYIWGTELGKAETVLKVYKESGWQFHEGNGGGKAKEGKGDLKDKCWVKTVPNCTAEAENVKVKLAEQLNGVISDTDGICTYEKSLQTQLKNMITKIVDGLVGET